MQQSPRSVKQNGERNETFNVNRAYHFGNTLHILLFQVPLRPQNFVEGFIALDRYGAMCRATQKVHFHTKIRLIIAEDLSNFVWTVLTRWQPSGKKASWDKKSDVTEINPV